MIVYTCNLCNHEHKKKTLKCASCGAFNSCFEEHKEDLIAYAEKPQVDDGVIPLSKVKEGEYSRLNLAESGINRVLGGGGVVTSSCIYFCGPPGCGKSTLLSMCSGRLANSGFKVLYFNLEEGRAQIKQRMKRLGYEMHDNVLLSTTNIVEMMIQQIQTYNPDLVIIDSLAKVRMRNDMGKITHMKYGAATFARKSKDLGIPMLIIGHITKDDSVAGPRLIEHEVDAVLIFEKVKKTGHRRLGVQKNRDGNDQETALYRMTDRGLIEIDETDFFLEERSMDLPGVAITAPLQGTKIAMCELHTLISSATNDPYLINGYDAGRFKTLCAIALKHKIVMHSLSIICDVPGGLTVQDRAVELAWIVSLHSSMREYVIPFDVVILGEISLAGAVRSVGDMDDRIRQIKKSGFHRVILPKTNEITTGAEGLELIGVSNIREACDVVEAIARQHEKEQKQIN